MEISDILLSVFKPDFLEGVAGIPDRAKRDRARIEAFMNAAGMKLRDFALDAIGAATQGDTAKVAYFLNQANLFRVSAQHVAGEAASAFQKLQFPKDLFTGRLKDPLKDWRNKVREFARVWDMDASFRDLLG